MIIELDFESEIPIYIQLRNKIIMGIGNGQLQLNEKLPTVRQLAEDIGINTMTVSKTYTLLKNEGFIAIDRRHGAKVSPTCYNKEFRNKIESELSLCITESALKGISKADFMDTCSKLFDSLSGLESIYSGV